MRTWILAVGLAGGLTAAVARAEDGADLAAIWSDPEFERQFLGTYGIHPDVEPKLGPQDRALLEKIYPLMGSDPAAAERELTAAATPDATALLDYILGNLAFQSGRDDEALAHFETAVRKFPPFRRAWKNLGVVRMRTGGYQEAIRAFTRMIELGGGDAVSYGLLGHAYASRDDFLASEAAFRNALLLDPDNTEWRLGLARSVVKQEKHQEAAALLGVLIERYPDRAEFWLLQANAYLGLKQGLRAAENLEIVWRLGKAKTDSMSLLGDIYVNEGRPDLAASAYSRAIDLGGDQTPERSLRSVEALAARGANAEAEKLASKIREAFGARLSPDESRRLLKLQARLGMAGGDAAEAAKVLEELVAVDPLDGEALLTLGQHYARTGDAERAMLLFERAENIPATELQARVRHAQALVGGGRYDEALPLLHRAQELKRSEELDQYVSQVERMARAKR